MTVKLLTEQHLQLLRLKGGCTGSSESTHIKMPHCWKSRTRFTALFYFWLLSYKRAANAQTSLCICMYMYSIARTVALTYTKYEFI